jgi:hypothetical protein
VNGQAFWDEPQASFFMIPSVNGIVNALAEAYDNRGHSDKAVEFAKQFDADKVWKESWLPFLKDLYK